MTTDLIPTNGVYVFPTEYPRGFQAAKYDAEGFAHELRWFPTRERAEAHAKTLKEAA